jgi:hypothetical protein
MAELWHDPERWRERAHEALAIVKYLGEPYAKLQMIKIAEAYSHLAQHAQKRANSKEDIESSGHSAITE